MKSKKQKQIEALSRLEAYQRQYVRASQMHPGGADPKEHATMREANILRRDKEIEILKGKIGLIKNAT